MQPYFLPYLGYFQLMAAVDAFVVYDDVKYTKKGWINRNRLLQNGKDAVFTLPLEAAPDSLDVRDRSISDDFDRRHLIERVRHAYRGAPFFDAAFDVFQRIVLHPERNLFAFLYHSLVETSAYLGIGAKLIVSSEIGVARSLRGEERVIATCLATGASLYVNPIGGRALYSRERFAERGIELRFLRPAEIEYRQFGSDFVPRLSILDAMMFNSRERIANLLATAFTLE